MSCFRPHDCYHVRPRDVGVSMETRFVNSPRSLILYIRRGKSSVTNVIVVIWKIISKGLKAELIFYNSYLIHDLKAEPHLPFLNYFLILHSEPSSRSLHHRARLLGYLCSVTDKYSMDVEVSMETRFVNSPRSINLYIRRGKSSVTNVLYK